MAAELEANALHMTFSDPYRADLLALDGVSFAVAEGEFLAIVGPSGCGKSTLLRLLGGLLRPISGEVCFRGQPHTAPRREIGFVFQRANLMPWRTVLDNIALPLEIDGLPKAEREALAHQQIALVGLEGFADAYPRQLSGGMQQRVGLARALAVNPEILLMDEPFGALDAQTRRLLQEDLLALLQPAPHTVVFVTHSVEEAVLLADRVVVLTPRPGRVRDIVTIDLPRPRPPDVNLLPRFSELTARLWRELKEAQS